MTVTTITCVLSDYSDDHAWVRATAKSTRRLLDGALRTRDYDTIFEQRVAAEATLHRAVRESMDISVRVEAEALVRYAERVTVLAIRAGQRAGEIRKQHAGNAPLPSPVDVARAGCRASLSHMYTLGDAPFKVFKAAVKAAREDRVMSRRNVNRHIDAITAAETTAVPAVATVSIPDPATRSPAARLRRAEVITAMAESGHDSGQMARHLGISVAGVRRIARAHDITIRADSLRSGARTFDSTRVGRDTVTALEALTAGLALINLTQIDPAEAAAWAGSLTESLHTLNQFAHNIRKQAR